MLSGLKVTVQVVVVLNRIVGESNRCFNNLCGSRNQTLF